jgi:uroporphyrin-III C-methyltransferase
MYNSTPKLTVVGAGPGDEDLITLKAVKALKDANVVLYDALVNPMLLKHAPQAEHIFVGKRKGYQRYSQEEINALIVQKAFACGHVVRLKGGDSFVFGRGAEEMEYAAQHGLETAVVPGISSAMGVPALQNIPLTQRGEAESFWVITGTTKEGCLSKDVELACQSTATVVILMGMSKLPQIVSLFTAAGKADLPVAIIQNGTTLQEKIAIGTVSTIEEEVRKNDLSNPAVILLGTVVNHREKMSAIEQQIVGLQKVELKGYLVLPSLGIKLNHLH